MSGKTTFMKLRATSSFEKPYSKQASNYTTCNKSKHVANKCFSRSFFINISLCYKWS